MVVVTSGNAIEGSVVVETAAVVVLLMFVRESISPLGGVKIRTGLDVDGGPIVMSSSNEGVVLGKVDVPVGEIVADEVVSPLTQG